MKERERGGSKQGKKGLLLEAGSYMSVRETLIPQSLRNVLYVTPMRKLGACNICDPICQVSLLPPSLSPILLGSSL